jgi:hypothetical protein
MTSRSTSDGLAPLPESFAATRQGLHMVAERIVAPSRKPDNEISLRATQGGFGTPVFEHGGLSRQVKVDGAELVYVKGEAETRAPIETLEQAGALVAELLPEGSDLDAAPLEIDAEAAAVLAAWFAFGARALEQLVADAPADHAPSPAVLWPEHFDVAIESGQEQEGGRANYGFSPGDESHPEPYLYVGPWRADVSGELWNATGFNGAELGYAELRRSDDPMREALDFCRARREALDSMEAAT